MWDKRTKERQMSLAAKTKISVWQESPEVAVQAIQRFGVHKELQEVRVHERGST